MWNVLHSRCLHPQFFELEADPPEAKDLAADPAHAEIRARLEAALRRIVDPEAAAALAFAHVELGREPSLQGLAGRLPES